MYKSLASSRSYIRYSDRRRWFGGSIVAVNLNLLKKKVCRIGGFSSPSVCIVLSGDWLVREVDFESTSDKE
jgi:hypothetical protein